MHAVGGLLLYRLSVGLRDTLKNKSISIIISFNYPLDYGKAKTVKL